MVPALVLALLLAQPPVAQPYKDDAVASVALGRTMKYRVLLPADYATSRGLYKTLYLLHCVTGDYMDWSTRTDLASMARDLPLVIVMPDGENAWYTNAAYEDQRFEDYIADDLVKDVESKYPRDPIAVWPRDRGPVDGRTTARSRSRSSDPNLFAAAGGFSSALGASDPAIRRRISRVPGRVVRGSTDRPAARPARPTTSCSSRTRPNRNQPRRFISIAGRRTGSSARTARWRRCCRSEV